jgi:stage II sporulation protein R
MHVRADSDQPEAQYVKELVSRDLVAYLSTRGLATASNLPEAVALLETELARIEEVARAVLAREGFSTDVRASLGVFHYEAREDFGFILPAGEYVALEVVLGSGEGKNFWCILFPGMCFVPPEVEDLAGERARGAIAEAAPRPSEPALDTVKEAGGKKFGWLWLDWLFGGPSRNVSAGPVIAAE